MEQNFKEKFNKLFEHLATEQQVTDDDIRSLMFGDYMTSKEEQRSYDEVEDLETLREVMETIRQNILHTSFIRSIFICMRTIFLVAIGTLL